ncbi:MAG: YjdF family protein [Eubacteriaceae bacterium]|nr:YjdF family protein [Eubacteriaceae bacterium]
MPEPVGSPAVTVFFEDPFWVAVFQRYENGKLSVAKVTLGAEPKNSELYELFLKNYYSLQFSPAVDVVVKEAKKNSKRIQREIRKAMDTPGVGTKSQQALQLQREQNKQERKARSRDAKQAEAQRRFELKQQKRKNKHRGR